MRPSSESNFLPNLSTERLVLQRTRNKFQQAKCVPRVQFRFHLLNELGIQGFPLFIYEQVAHTLVSGLINW